MSELISNPNDAESSDAPISRIQIALAAIADGSNVRDAAASIGASTARFYAWVEANEELRARYQDAQIRKAVKKYGTGAK